MRLTIGNRIYLTTALSALCAIVVCSVSLLYLGQLLRRDAETQARVVVNAGLSLVSHFERLANAGRLSEADAQRQALTALADLRYDGSNYLFVMSDGRILMHPIKPALDGQDVGTIKDVNGQAFFKQLYQGAVANGTTTVTYRWPKPGSDRPVAKVSLAQRDDQWGWVVGSGIYLDAVRRDLLFQASQLAAISGLVIVVITLLSLKSAAIIRRAVRLCVDELRALRQGEIDRPLSDVQRRDELGDIARGLADLQGALAEKVELQAEARRHQQDIANKLAAAEAGHRQASEDQVQALTALQEALDRLASGRLDAPIRDQLPSGYDELRCDLNQAIASLNQVLCAAENMLGEVEGGSAEVAKVAAQVSKRGEQQASGLEQTAAALEEIVTTVRQTSAGMLSIEQLAKAARRSSDDSAEIVSSTLDAMADIEAAARQIGEIIHVIDEIAFQTNLLALNAGVEAARAGDAGRGFAVVASEVRILAQRCAQAAKDIKGLIANSARSVGQGGALVRKTADVLVEIGQEIGAISSKISDISASSREQSTGLEQINVAVAEMDRLTQENSAMIDQTAVAADRLSEDARALRQHLSRFRLDHERSVSDDARIVRMQARRVGSRR